MSLPLVRDSIPSLHGLSPREYSTWLCGGAGAFLLEGTDPHQAFPGAGSYIGWSGSLEEDLAVIYGALNTREQADFRLGITLCLAEQVTERRWWPELHSMVLRLAAVTRAHEILEVLPSLVAGASKIPDDASLPVIRLALNVTVELSVQTSSTLRSLHLLIGSAGFREEIAPAALLALARAEPTNLPVHLDLLGRYLNSRYSAAACSDPLRAEERDELVLAIAQVTPTVAMAEAFDPRRRTKAYTSDWIVHDWFCRAFSSSTEQRVVALASEIETWSKVTDSTDVGETAWDYPSPTSEYDQALGPLPSEEEHGYELEELV